MKTEFENPKLEIPENVGRVNRGGRPIGAKSKTTVIKEAAQEMILQDNQIEIKKNIQKFHNRIGKKIDSIFNAQYSLAVGNQYLFKVIESTDDKGRPNNKKHVLVTDPDEIKAFLDGDSEGSYYYMTTEKPDNAAAEALLNRYMGRAAQTLAIPEGKGNKAPTIAIINYGDTDSV